MLRVSASLRQQAHSRAAQSGRVLACPSLGSSFRWAAPEPQQVGGEGPCGGHPDH